MSLFQSIQTSKDISHLLKGAAIIAVVLIHALTLFPEGVYLNKSYSFLFFAVNQGLRFCVPAFVFLSGFGLSIKYQSREFNFFQFLKKRAAKLLPLYLLWAVYLAALAFFPGFNHSLSQRSLVEIMLLGQADYHLYFVPMILQMYVLFGIYRTFSKKLPVWLLLAAVGIQTLVYSYFSLSFNLPSDQIQYLLVLSWIGYFALGIWAANNKKLLSPAASKLLLTAGLVSSIIYSYLTARKTSNVLQANRFTKSFTFAYSLGLISWLTGRSWDGFSRFRKAGFDLIKKLGRNSYFIYLAHTVPLHFLESRLGPLAAFTVAASYVLVVYLSKVMVNSSYATSIGQEAGGS